MGNLLFIGYEAATVLLPALVIYFIMAHSRKKRGLRNSPVTVVLLIVFAIYITLVFDVTGTGTVYDIVRVGLEYSPEQVNLIPFFVDSFSLQHMLNVIMFVPFGLLIPLVWPGAGKLRHALLYGFGFSLLIELSQLFNNRVTDVDDLLMNTLGALVGFGIYWLFKGAKRMRVCDEVGVNELQEMRESALLPAVTLGAMFVTHFLLYNPLGLVGILYN